MRYFRKNSAAFVPSLLLLGAALSLATACASSPTTSTASAAQADGGASGASAATSDEALQAGFYRTRIGAIAVTVLSDGTAGLDLSQGLLLNAQPGEVDRLLAQAFQKSPIEASFNVFLLTIGDRTLLIDTGAGTNFGPTAGKLAGSLMQSGTRAEDITDIFLTHVHPDHSGGLVVDGKRAFPKATLHVEQKELDYWLNKAAAAKATGMEATFFAAASASLQPYIDAGRVKAFSGATDFMPGFSAQPAYGHTPGHVMYSLVSQGEKLLFWGDLVHIAAVQFDDPKVAVAFDVDSALAVQTRQRALIAASEGGYLIAQNHVSFPGIGHVGRSGDAYRWVPTPYVNDSTAKH